MHLSFPLFSIWQSLMSLLRGSMNNTEDLLVDFYFCGGRITGFKQLEKVKRSKMVNFESNYFDLLYTFNNSFRCLQLVSQNCVGKRDGIQWSWHCQGERKENNLSYEMKTYFYTHKMHLEIMENHYSIVKLHPWGFQEKSNFFKFLILLFHWPINSEM